MRLYIDSMTVNIDKQNLLFYTDHAYNLVQFISRRFILIRQYIKIIFIFKPSGR
jgi:hypothetical protein